MKRTNSPADALNRNKIVVSVGDGLPDIELPLDGNFGGGKGEKGDGVPAGGAPLQVVRKTAAGTTTEWATLTPGTVGLSNVDNTADENKPLSIPQALALTNKADLVDGKVPATQIPTFQKSVVGLSNVDNTADVDKPVSKAQAAAQKAAAGGIISAPEPSGVDDTTTLRGLLESGSGGTARLQAGKVYKITDTLTVPTGTTFDLNGATIDARGIPAGTKLGQRIAISSSGSLGDDLPITTVMPQWSRKVAGISTTSGLAAGDLILLSNDESPVPGLTRTDRDKGELNVIQSVDSATQITLTTGALFAYGITGFKVRKLSPVENITVQDGNILLNGASSAHSGIQVRYGRNINIRNVTVDGAEDTAIGMNTVWDGKVQTCTVHNSTSSTTLGNTGYGVAVVEGSRHVSVENNIFENCRHFVAGGGYWPASFIEVKGNKGQRSSDAAYDCHESCFYWTFTKNTATGVASGFIIRGQFITVDGNEITDSLGRAYRAATFDGVTEQRGIRIINNKATQCAYGIEVDGQALGAEPNCLKIDTEITGNTLSNAGLNPIMLRHFDGAEVAANKVFGSAGHAVLILGLPTAQSRGLAITGNQVRQAALDGVKVQYVDDVTGSGGQIVSPGNYGVELLNCSRTSLSGGLTVRNPTFSGVFISGGAIHSMDGIVVSGGVGPTYDAVRISGTSDVTVTGGYLASARWAVFSTTTDYVVVTGVNVRGAASAGKVSCDATNKVIANNLVA